MSLRKIWFPAFAVLELAPDSRPVNANIVIAKTVNKTDSGAEKEMEVTCKGSEDCCCCCCCPERGRELRWLPARLRPRSVARRVRAVGKLPSRACASNHTTSQLSTALCQVLAGHEMRWSSRSCPVKCSNCRRECCRLHGLLSDGMFCGQGIRD